MRANKKRNIYKNFGPQIKYMTEKNEYDWTVEK